MLFFFFNIFSGPSTEKQDVSYRAKFVCCPSLEEAGRGEEGEAIVDLFNYSFERKWSWCKKVLLPASEECRLSTSLGYNFILFLLSEPRLFKSF